LKLDHSSVHISHIKRSSTQNQALFLGPMVVVIVPRVVPILQLNGAVSRLQYAAFQIIPYLARLPDCIPVTSCWTMQIGGCPVHSESFPLQMNCWAKLIIEWCCWQVHLQVESFLNEAGHPPTLHRQQGSDRYTVRKPCQVGNDLKGSILKS